MLAVVSVVLVLAQGPQHPGKLLPAWAHFDSVTFQSPVSVDWHRVAGRALRHLNLERPDSGTLKRHLSPFGPSSAVDFGDDALPGNVPHRHYYVIGPGMWGSVTPTRVEGFVEYDLKEGSWAVESTTYRGFLSATLPSGWASGAAPAFVIWSPSPDTVAIFPGKAVAGRDTVGKLALTLTINGRVEQVELWEFDSVPHRLYRPVNSFGPPDRTWVVRSRALGEFVVLEWYASDLCTTAFVAFVTGGKPHVLASSDAECAD